MKKTITKIFALLAVAVVMSSFVVSAASYTYNYKKEAVRTPEATRVLMCVDNEYAGWGSLQSPEDMSVAANGYVYIADTVNKRIVVLDNNYKFVKEIKTMIDKDGSEVALQTPTGVFFHDASGNLYIADTDGHYVYIVDENNNLVNKLTASAEETFKENFVFSPTKVTVDYAGRVFVIAESVYDGLMEFDTQGVFMGYTGANKVTPSAMDLIWRSIATEEQRQKMVKLIPTEFDNIDVDPDGFVYTVTKSVSTYDPASSNPIRKQTVKGVNILYEGSLGVPIGDLKYPYMDATKVGPSSFIDISVNTDYGYSVIDEKRSRVFVYNNAGDILFAFAGEGAAKGYFTTPIAIESYGDNIAVLDKTTGTITVFEFTEYGKLIIQAENHYLDGEYDEALEDWNAVLRKNSGLDIAYVGIGKILIVKGQYKEAMDYLKAGGDKEYYSKAWKFYREEVAGANSHFIVLGIVAIIALYFIYSKFIKKKIKFRNPFKDKEWYKGVKYSKYIMFHPFDGFWDMTHEKRGNLASAGIIYGLFVFVLILKAQFTGYIFAGVDSQFNLLSILTGSLIPIFLWCLCNWSVTTLFNGDGGPKSIVMATAYCLVPYIIVEIPMILLSNFLTTEEGTIMTAISALAIAWCGLLLLAAMITIHQYTISEALLTIIVTVVGMVLVVFVVVLVYNLVQQMLIFLVSIYNEIVLRM